MAEIQRHAIGDAACPPWMTSVLNALAYIRRTSERDIWSYDDLIALWERKANAHRAYSFALPFGIKMMSIPAAKNRQFRDVVVLWPAGVPGGADRQRRLLYNAITRAEQNCTVLVQTADILRHPPFSPAPS